MSVNLNAAAFTLDTSGASYGKRAVAEAYMQMYQYAAQDFIAQSDFQKFVLDLHSWMARVDLKLSQQMSLISTHTHTIPPHSHGMQGAQPVPLTTMAPVTAPRIFWAPVTYPIFINTTGALPNLVGNRISVSIASEGSAIPTIRRFLPIPTTLIPTLSPVITDSLKNAIL